MLVKIGDIATIEKNVATPDDLKGNFQNFIGLENIEKASGRLVNFSETSGDELRSTKFKFTQEHILYGKLRPYLNKVFLPDFEGVCSTDILTIKPHPKKVLRKFLELILKGSDFVDYATNRSIGANLPRVSPSTVLDYSFALPPIPIQHQIVAVLEQAEAVKRQRQEADALTGALLQSVFRGMFGDPVRNDRKWIVEKFGDISKINMGQSPPGESYNRDGRGIALLNGPEEFGDKYPTPKQYTDKPSKICEIGDILFCVRGATAGRMNWSDNNYCIGRGLAAIQCIPKKSDIRFLYQFLSMNYEKFQKTGRGSTFINISRADLTDLKIPLPPLALQQQFAQIVESVERIRKRQVASGKEIEGLCEGLMQRAFAGELSTGNV